MHQLHQQHGLHHPQHGGHHGALPVHGHGIAPSPIGSAGLWSNTPQAANGDNWQAGFFGAPGHGPGQFGMGHHLHQHQHQQHQQHNAQANANAAASGAHAGA